MKRVCSCCKIEKIIDSFHRNQSESSGYSYKCKDCVRESNKSKNIKPIIPIKGEYWKDIEGFIGYYQVSNKGRVKSLSREKFSPFGNFISQEHLLKQRLSNCGYCRVHLRKTVNGRHLSVHRLVASAFIPLVKNRTEVNHLNGIKTDNSLENLEWVTTSENGTHYFSNINKSNKKWGVLFEKRYNKWTVVIRVAEKKRKYIGTYKTQELAIEARNEAILKYGIVNKYA